MTFSDPQELSNLKKGLLVSTVEKYTFLSDKVLLPALTLLPNLRLCEKRSACLQSFAA